ncbi:hypothetical protein [Salinibacter ruber]|uniref:Uncharacterized protein n=1 Tax=Salinibacter ruber TaxID=146919 RepID=A0A9X2TKP2_9BACT|nr:hypothetical protein [Salinibacter ruber]MCS3661154.1 hypothetical protein [Salinibacter ruber]MCS3710953.1 hypothetical protein [Salinibacter ruber]
MIDPLAGPLLKLWKNPAISVFWMLLNDLANTIHQLLLLLGWLVRSLLSVVGAFRQTDRLKAPVQCTIFSVLIHEADLLGRSQLSPKKFFSRAISTSFLPTMRSSFAILSFFSFS